MSNHTEDKIPYTPSSFLSRMTINSQSNGLSRIRPSQRFELSTTSFQERLMRKMYEEELNSGHPNLTMMIGPEKISMYKTKQSSPISCAEDNDDDESDNDDLFSSDLYSINASDCMMTTQSIFDQQEDTMEDDVYDATDDWLSCIYHDNQDPSCVPSNIQQVTNQPDEENQPTPMHMARQLSSKRIYPLNENNEIEERQPLAEIYLAHDLSDVEDYPAKKKVIVIKNNKPRKIRLMRSLSPPRFPTKNKE
ncbi:uncharacterized protein B0P05DRAFT_535772 [Gilbertella persicaria]|uniref:Uncharacterized protein n=1 Tax=Rhizopus stolonifer TaxID=4846 RepID=A0A367IL77_RHIST|nr:uncharacterized protein B0P05DRAFT_535772 [Gilbertella persicaria]KAI8083994.1 hypothetical protein B0P05DRAFT_535772 [Gilbertella persicaria]RCH78386.1 hypothetical protein CU098_005818 [Rhizopus stolonifer]